MPLATLVGAFVLSLPSVVELSGTAAFPVEVFSVTQLSRGKVVALPRGTALLRRRLEGVTPLSGSRHREDEAGAVILEMGPDGAQRLHCDGHRFFTGEK